MIVQKSRLVLDDEEARLVATVESERGHFTPFEVVIGVPRHYVGWLDMSGNPFVPTFALLANVLGERLRVEGTVSPRLLESANKACQLFQAWWKMAPVTVEAEAVAAPRHPGEGGALFFTRGVDSWHSALRDRAGLAGRPVSHLLYAADFDRQYTAATRRRAVTLTREAAGLLGRPLITVSHNGRELLDRFLNWELAHGGVLAGIGLALGGWVADVYRASCIDADHLVPWGSHPELDALWSTERTTSHLDGVEFTRTQKVRAIAASDLALTRLKVCWREDIDTNCGRCEKCIRTQIALAIAGALDRAPVFEGPLTPKAVSDLPAIGESEPPSGQEVLWSELCESFPSRPALADLRSAAVARLPARHPLATARPRVISQCIKVEAPPGAAVSLLPVAASSVLRTPVPSGAQATTSSWPANRLEFSWTTPTAGRLSLPLRPPAAMSLEILDACRTAADRPVRWCLISFASHETARLMERLTESWGQGIVCLGRPGKADGDHGVARGEASKIQRFSDIRVWWGDGDYLDPFLVLESLRHGCLPLQCVPQAGHDALVARLPGGLSHFTLAIPDQGTVPTISPDERAARIEQGLSILLAGTMERDLASVIPSFECKLI